MPQSLSNVLVVVKRRLGQLQASQAHTTEDLRHYRVRSKSGRRGLPSSCA